MGVFCEGSDCTGPVLELCGLRSSDTGSVWNRFHEDSTALFVWDDTCVKCYVVHVALVF